ncbi:polysaccharide biosynthesis protein [Rossellomorea vietnamensis]|uniref:Polysaccharide biosynthesis protein n=1 Tax=Rossellomorea vietnamensis TaxID=218284 RepID=A0ACD4CAK2_9BACI|nr:polysaccharide biosynthesis protein [Rossellomorea vietnamensis]UXH45326.1 polysaccharide biosynthesis protein [Rossellomorea vietnamensis]
MFPNKIILVTGGTGSWGQELITQLLSKGPKEIRIFSRNETSQVAMKHKFENNAKLKFIIGDVRDKDAVLDACDGVDYIFHLAALKHVPVCEFQPLEALKTNVLGTQNIIDAAIEKDIEKVINISTDKAANPSNFYGYTKAMAEKLIINANLLTNKTKFVCVRGGNVLGTSGSVIHLFKHDIKSKNKVRITDKKMTRFFLTIKDAISLLFKATYESHGGEIFVMKMPTFKIIELAHVLIDEYSPNKEVNIEEIGIRPGEKLHELLLTEFESQNTVVYDNEYFVILPTIPNNGLLEYYQSYPKVDLETYSSKDNIIDYDQIKTMLKDGGFLE